MVVLRIFEMIKLSYLSLAHVSVPHLVDKQSEIGISDKSFVADVIAGYDISLIFFV